MTTKHHTPLANTHITRQDFMDFFRSEDGWADLTAANRREVFLDILRSDGDLTAGILTDLITRYGADDRLEVKDKEYATLYVLSMEDAEATLHELGHRPTKDQLDEMEHSIRKGLEWGLCDCWHDVMTIACEEAWEGLKSEQSIRKSPK